MTTSRPSLVGLRAAANAWQAEITTPGHYETEAFHALEDALLGDGPAVALALVEAVEALRELHAAVCNQGEQFPLPAEHPTMRRAREVLRDA